MDKILQIILNFFSTLPRYPRPVKAVFLIWLILSLVLLITAFLRLSAPIEIRLEADPITEGTIKLLEANQEIGSLDLSAGESLRLFDLHRYSQLKNLRFRLLDELGKEYEGEIRWPDSLAGYIAFHRESTIIPEAQKQRSENLEYETAFLNLAFDSMPLHELERYLGQLFLVGFDGDWWRSSVGSRPIAPTLVEEFGVGGVILFERNVPYLAASDISFQQKQRALAEFISKMKSTSTERGAPLIVTTDYEGGHVQQIRSGLLTELPSAMAIGSLQDSRAAFISGRIAGSELSAYGFNMNLAPVVDVSMNSYNELIGDRSFGGDAEFVTEFGRQFVNGQSAEGLVSVLKHYPGHGSTSQGDETPGVPTSRLGLSNLNHTLSPFRDISTPAVMTSHFDLENKGLKTVTFEPMLTEQLLRQDDAVTIKNSTIDALGFKGLLIADDLCSPSITAETDQPNDDVYAGRVAMAALRAFDAGHDLLLLAHVFPNDTPEEELRKGNQYRTALTLAEFSQVYEHLKTKIFDDDPTGERVLRLRESLTRIRDLKRALEVRKEQSTWSDVELGSMEWQSRLKRKQACHRKIALEMFKSSFSSICSSSSPADLSMLKSNDSVAVFFPTRHKSLQSTLPPSDPAKNALWRTNLERNVQAWDLPRAISDLWGEQFHVDFFMIPKWLREDDRAPLVDYGSSIIADSRYKSVVFIIWSRMQLEVLIQILEANLAASQDISKVHIVVTRPSLLTSLQLNRRDILSSITVTVAYSGEKEHSRAFAQFLLQGAEPSGSPPVSIEPWHHFSPHTSNADTQSRWTTLFDKDSNCSA